MMRIARVVSLAVAPLAAAYFASYFFRTINALISKDLIQQLALSADQIGVLTALYFFAFAVVQLPSGALLDRFGVRRLQSILLLIAAVGALVFAFGRSFEVLALGRGLIGLGVSTSLIAGMKVNASLFDKGDLPLANGCFICAGSLGVITSTAPSQWVVDTWGWPALFLGAAAFCTVCALTVWLLVPDMPPKPSADRPRRQLRAILADRRFQKLAPLSMMCISTAWALQGLWASHWLRDVSAISESEVVQHLMVMAIALSAGALCIGAVTKLLRKRGVSLEAILAGASLLFMTAEVSLLLEWPLSTWVAWSFVAAAGAATVISYSIIADYFDARVIGQANGALNTFHIGGAFVIQAGIGWILSLWQATGGFYPSAAYKCAFVTIIAAQALALAWFILPAGSLSRNVDGDEPNEGITPPTPSTNAR